MPCRTETASAPRRNGLPLRGRVYGANTPRARGAIPGLWTRSPCSSGSLIGASVTQPGCSACTVSDNLPLRVVVLSCGDLGIEVANALSEDGAVRVVGLISTPYRTPRRSVVGKIRHLYRMQGWIGFPKLVLHKIGTFGSTASSPSSDTSALRLRPEIPHLSFGDFHDANAREAVAKLCPDLGVVAGTYILQESVFRIPQLGSINLHSGEVPRYRGAAPAFWELYNGESSVGITIHRVETSVDAGRVLKQETFSLDRAPAGDPSEYIETYRRSVLRPNGVRMMVDTVRAIAEGTTTERAQDITLAQTYKSPDYRAVRELHRRIRIRRRAMK